MSEEKKYYKKSKSSTSAHDNAVSETVNQDIDQEHIIQAEEVSEQEEDRKEVEAFCVTVKHRHNRGYYDDNGVGCKSGDRVIADTGNGLEYGTVYFPARMTKSENIVLPLGRIVRRATQADTAQFVENGEREIDAFNRCLGFIEESSLPMKLIDAEYAFDRSRLTFYFSAEDRVDFRELVKVLASSFRTRIDLRQIGIRDEARIIGGLGSCGRPFCCKTFQPESCQMSIKMAKEQGLSLNSGKISGTCNRLMCCLRYEHDFYKEQLAKMPKINSTVTTADGDGVVIEINPVSEKVKVLIENTTMARSYHYTDVTVTGHLKGKPKKVQTT
ncbi:MAG: stage 0 sporulation family protein [Clostridia bacterium]|nr:stage 0 sporulation family protein [Clostridia bacterium]